MNDRVLKDLVASLGVFVIAVPLSLGVALASGMPPAAGLIAAIVGGIIVGLLAGAPLVVSGPAAGLAALVFQFVQQYGLVGIAWITLIGGALQIGLGVIRSGFIFNYVPKAVLEGMLAAIGLIIAANQLFILVGLDIPNSLREGFMSLLAGESSVGLEILGIGVFALLSQIYWPKLFPNLKAIPGALPAVILGTIIAIPLELPRVTLEPLLDVAGAGFASIVGTLDTHNLAIYILPAIGLALVASAESLLTARAIQTQAPAGQRLDLNQELIAQGVGNMTCGAIGGMPITGVIVRGSANINFGATSRWSAIFHGAWIVLFCLGLPFVLTSIPLTVLASVLIVTGAKLFNVGRLVEYAKTDISAAALWLVTVGAIVAIDLLTGLVIALVSAALLNGKAILPVLHNNFRYLKLIYLKRRRHRGLQLSIARSRKN